MSVEVRDMQGWRRPGCSDHCGVIVAFVPGGSGRTRIEQHDVEAHEAWGALNTDVTVDGSVIVSGPLRVNLTRGTVSVDEQTAHLSPTEWYVLRELAMRQGQWVEAATLIRRVWSDGAVSERNRGRLRVAVQRLRARLGAAGGLIETWPGFGYGLSAITGGRRCDP